MKSNIETFTYIYVLLCIAVQNFLNDNRFTATSTRRNIKRQRLNVELGKIVTAANNDEDSSNSDVPTRNLTNDDSDDNHTEAAAKETQEESEYITPQKEQIVVGKFVLVQKGDEFLADESDIIAILPDPQAATVHGELPYSFQKNIDIFETM
ncbi:hypothetical protein FQA39_LY01972 [Lamprigera yunnana]|nr:hypothetical protein FQA39_LY01972 [Lamprigera yunnana]